MAKKSKIQYGAPVGGVNPAPSAANASGGAPKGALIAGAVALLAVIIVVVIFAVRDGGGQDVNKVSFSPSIDITGEVLPPMGDAGIDEAIGRTIPTIAGKDFDGNDVVIEPGEPMFIVVMAHWCPHCQAEIPRIVEWRKDGLLSEEVKIVGLSTHVEEARGNFPPASWLEREKWTFPVMADNRTRDALNALGISGYPGMLAVNADGVVVDRTSGEQGLEKVQAMFAAALGEGEPTTDDATVEEDQGLSSPVEGN